MHDADPRKSYQPLDPSVRKLLDPEYVAFHDEYIQYIEPDDIRIWNAAEMRGRRMPGSSTPVPVAGIEDFQVADFPVRVFWPLGQRPSRGWPVLVWYHGGGWAVGSIGSENDFCTKMCRDANCVVVTVGYRLAPEHVYPTAVEDALQALVWVHSQAGRQTLSSDSSRIAIGGTSAMYMAALDVTDWTASPNLTPSELLRKSPKTWLGVADQDLLAPEAWSFAEQLHKLGVEVEVVNYKGMTHTILAMNGILSKGRQLVIDAGQVLKRALGDL